MSEHVSGRCVKLPKGSKSSSPGRCPKGMTWRKGYDRNVRHTRKALKSIESGMKTRLSNHRVRRRCSDEEIADALNYCMTKFIEPVQVHIKKQDHYDLEPLSSPSTLMMIERKARMGTNCVIRALSHCGADRGQIRLLVDDYLSQELSTESMTSAFDKNIIENRVGKVNALEDFVSNFRSGMRSHDGSDAGSDIDSILSID